jgi:hypothetical protein
MRGDIPPFTMYAFMSWCLSKVQGQLYRHACIGAKLITLLRLVVLIFLVSTSLNVFECLNTIYVLCYGLRRHTSSGFSVQL